MITSSVVTQPYQTLNSIRESIMAEYMERVKQLKEGLDWEFQAQGSDAFERSLSGRAFLNNLVSGSTISSALRHVATECAAQDYWHYNLSSSGHFRAIEHAQRAISLMVKSADIHHKAVAELKRERDAALDALTPQTT